MNPYVIAAIVLGIAGSAAYGGYQWADNRDQAKIASCKENAATAVSEAYKARDKAMADLLIAQQAKEQAIRKLGETYVTQIATLKRSNTGLSGRLRDALTKTCLTVRSIVMPQTPSSPSGGNDGSTSDRLRGRIAEGLERRIVEPANIQTAQLMACQAYIRAIQ